MVMACEKREQRQITGSSDVRATGMGKMEKIRNGSRGTNLANGREFANQGFTTDRGG